MRKNRKKKYERHNIWRSYSDIMAGLLLLFVLVMCISFMQAQKSYQDKLAEEAEHQTTQATLLAQLAELVEQNTLQQATLDEQTSTLAQQESELTAQSLQLAEQESELDLQTAEALAQQALLDAQAAQLALQSATLAQQESELNAQALQMASQQTTLDLQTALMEQQQARIEQIIGVKADLIAELKQEFNNLSMNVSIDQDGSIALDSNVLFSFNEDQLTDEGTMVLGEVLPVYCHVLLSPQYLDYIAELSVNGYTDTSGSYIYNMRLSEERALAVADYLLTMAETMLNKDEILTLQDKLSVNGHSMSNPVYNEDGSINMDASRRVVVRFRLKDEEMINELREVMNAVSAETAEETVVDSSVETVIE